MHGLVDSSIRIGHHFVEKVTAHKKLRIVYYRTSMFKDYYKFAQACD
jgi:hypothetical protein